MTAAVPTSSELTCVLPPQLYALGEALAPVAKAARQALVRRVRSSGQDFVTLDSLSRHMGGIEHALSRLNPRLEGLMSEVIRKEGVGPLEVGRSADRLGQVLSELVDGYLDAKAWSHRSGHSTHEMTGRGYSAPSARSPLDSACLRLCSGENMDNQRKSALDPLLVVERESEV